MANETIDMNEITLKLRSSVETWKDVMFCAAETEQQRERFEDTVIQMHKIIDIIQTAKVREMKALGMVMLNSVFYGSPFIEKLLIAFNLLAQGKDLIEVPKAKILEPTIGNA